MHDAYLTRIATATFENEVHGAFIRFAHDLLDDERSRTLFLRMADRCGIECRFSPLSVQPPFAHDAVNAHALYRRGAFPGTAERMQLFRRFAPVLMRTALERLAITQQERAAIRHVIVTTCTGFYAPGLDFEVCDILGLDPSVERTMIGFMGCYAAINALKQARHIVRSQPEDTVLVVNLELCTLHLQESQDLGELLSFLVFGDGCSAALISAQPLGLHMTSFSAMRLDDTAELITWHVGDQGFQMVLSGQVPLSVATALQARGTELTRGREVRHWAVHPGGRSVLDAVEAALQLPPEALSHSRSVLRRYGNMSSATVMFVLQHVMATANAGEEGCAMSFGPGVTAEMMHFTVTGEAA